MCRPGCLEFFSKNLISDDVVGKKAIEVGGRDVNNGSAPRPDWKAVQAETRGGASFRVASVLTDSYLATDDYDICIMGTVLENLPPGGYEWFSRRSFAS
jgi:hypothetical protein